MVNDEQLVPALRGQLNNCTCGAYGRHECGGCGAIWPEDVTHQAADEIVRLREEVRQLKEENK